MGFLAEAALFGCAASPPPLPPASPRPDPPAKVAADRPPPEPSESRPAAPPAPPEPPGDPRPKAQMAVAAPEQPPVTITIEFPYKLGERPTPESPTDPVERRRWNEGNRGNLVSALPPEGHPFPRVIVDVVKVKGPHEAASIQKIARGSLWGRIINCYRLGAYKDQSLKGKTTVRFQVSRAGKASRAAVASSTLPDKEVASCLAGEFNALQFERAKAGSSVTATIEVSPGDDPQPPPASAVKPGSGVLRPTEVRRVVLTAVPRIEACYRAGLVALPELWGRIEVRLHVTASGKVDEAFETESSFPEKRVTRCVLRELRGLELPPPTGGDVRVMVPIRLWSGEKHPVNVTERPRGMVIEY
jgi:outer membrane biosynthesis protein TonB